MKQRAPQRGTGGPACATRSALCRWNGVGGLRLRTKEERVLGDSGLSWEALTSRGEVAAGSPVWGILAVPVGQPGQEREGRQVQGQGDRVQDVPPVREVTAQALDPHFLTLKPQEA